MFTETVADDLVRAQRNEKRGGVHTEDKLFQIEKLVAAHGAENDVVLLVGVCAGRPEEGSASADLADNGAADLLFSVGDYQRHLAVVGAVEYRVQHA